MQASQRVFLAQVLVSVGVVARKDGQSYRAWRRVGVGRGAGIRWAPGSWARRHQAAFVAARASLPAKAPWGSARRPVCRDGPETRV